MLEGRLFVIIGCAQFLVDPERISHRAIVIDQRGKILATVIFKVAAGVIDILNEEVIDLLRAREKT